MGSNWKYIVILVVCFGLVIFAQLNKPKQFNWTPTFSKQDKNPYGTYVLYDLMEDVFPENKIKTINSTIYETLTYDDYFDEIYMFVGQDFSPDNSDLPKLIDFVVDGGLVFVAAEQYGGLFEDTLEVSTNFRFSFKKSDSLSLNFVNERLKAPKDYLYKNGTVDYFFSDYNTDYTTVLATNSQDEATFIKVKVGDGAFYLSSTPFAFTNYNVIARNNDEYIVKCLSHLPERNILWDEYFKTGRQETRTPLRVVLSRPSLTWSMYLALALVFIFVLFEIKRRQRIIELLDPMDNTTLEFTETIGRLYFQHKDNLNIAKKQITYFFEYLRNELYLNLNSPDEKYIERVAEKSGVDNQTVVSLFTIMNYILNKSDDDYLDDTTLIQLNEWIEDFMEKSKL